MNGFIDRVVIRALGLAPIVHPRRDAALHTPSMPARDLVDEPDGVATEFAQDDLRDTSRHASAHLDRQSDPVGRHIEPLSQLEAHTNGLREAMFPLAHASLDRDVAAGSDERAARAGTEPTTEDVGGTSTLSLAAEALPPATLAGSAQALDDIGAKRRPVATAGRNAIRAASSTEAPHDGDELDDVSVASRAERGSSPVVQRASATIDARSSRRSIVRAAPQGATFKARSGDGAEVRLSVSNAIDSEAPVRESLAANDESSGPERSDRASHPAVDGVRDAARSASFDRELTINVSIGNIEVARPAPPVAPPPARPAVPRPSLRDYLNERRSVCGR